MLLGKFFGENYPRSLPTTSMCHLGRVHICLVTSYDLQKAVPVHYISDIVWAKLLIISPWQWTYD